MAQNSLDIHLYICCVRYQVAFAPFCSSLQLGASNYEAMVHRNYEIISCCHRARKEWSYNLLHSAGFQTGHKVTDARKSVC